MKKQQAELHLVGRAQFKSNGLVLYRISSGEKSYDVTMARGRVTSCCETNGESCKGFTYGKGQCRHAEYALAREQELAAVREAERVVAEPKPIGIGDKGTLSSNRGFSLMAV